MKRFIILACIAALTCTGCNGGASSSTPPTTNRGQSWMVQAGGSANSEASQTLEFYPNSLTIDAGDSVTWSFPAGEPHTVTFLGPQATPPPPNDPNDQQPAGGHSYDGSTYTSSGFILLGKSYTLTFTKPGTYTYYCLIHGEMEGTIVVQPAGTAYPQSQSQVTAAGQASLQSALADASNALTLFPYASGGSHLAAGISSGLGASAPGAASVVRFLDGSSLTDTNVTVSVGTTVTWTNLDSNLPHTVTFPVAGQDVPPMDPFSPASGPSSYDGSALVNSGALMPGQSFSLTFTKAGTYSYHCLFHDDTEGMIGTVTVQ